MITARLGKILPRYKMSRKLCTRKRTIDCHQLAPQDPDHDPSSKPKATFNSITTTIITTTTHL
jgi:hypothetical protein